MSREAKPAVVRSIRHPGGTIQLLSPDAHRTALTIQSPDGQCYIWNDKTASISSGFVVKIDNPPLEFCRCHQGTFVNGEIWAASAGGACTLNIIEGFEPWPPNDNGQ